MAVDHRKLLKDCIRGMIWDLDVPVPPAAIDVAGAADGSTAEELELFWQLTSEVLAEYLETRPMILSGLAELKQSCVRES
jgi:hypothetical protein